MTLLPTIFGLNYTFWLIISFLRFITEEVLKRLPWMKKKFVSSTTPLQRIPLDQVAVIMAAHNEEVALSATLETLKKNIPADQIYIGSDGSTDQTVEIARSHNCPVVDLQPNRGKSKTLTYLLEHFQILKRYQAVVIMDAEIIVGDNYFNTILPYFDDQKVVAFVSHAHSRWHQHWLPKWSMFLTAYRVRLWLMLYYGLRYGQTWKYFCVTPIIPGGSSMYRSSALAQIEIDTPGFIIEDFHMTFQVFHKKLGLIASHPSAYIIDQEPYTLREYIHQVHRWFLGFWQAFFYHGFWPSPFWFATSIFALEMIVYSLFVFLIPILIVYLLITNQYATPLVHLTFAPLGIEQSPITLPELLIAAFVTDYALTMIAAWIEAKPVLFFYGLGFFIPRYVDTLVFLWSLPEALLVKTPTGTWVSPARKKVE